MGFSQFYSNDGILIWSGLFSFESASSNQPKKYKIKLIHNKIG